ncbi:single stranded DNA-binding domain-containing protein [Horticoccus sp. 23ND18S-11]|uniref:hypothetical protein n=1 Tax=Horticoccus sp. 23ND18S-11 TaxID=3391832 RepID=UPI0039C99863
MTPRSETIYLITILVTLWIVLPLIPAILLYRLFPQSKVTAEGVVSNWKIRATGAFGGYLAVFAPGYHPINLGISSVLSPISCVWEISANVELKDSNGKSVPVINRPPLVVTLEPDGVAKSSQFVQVKIPSLGPDLPRSIVTIESPKFGREAINLDDPAVRERIEIQGTKVRFKQPIVIAQEGDGKLYVDKTYLEPSSQ